MSCRTTKGLCLLTCDADRCEFVARTPVVTAVVASNIVPRAADAQGRASYWAVGAAGSVLRYVSAD